MNDKQKSFLIRIIAWVVGSVIGVRYLAHGTWMNALVCALFVVILGLLTRTADLRKDSD